MNGVVFHTSTRIAAISKSVRLDRIGDEAYVVGHILDNPDLALEHQAPHDRRDNRGERPRHENGGPYQPPAPEGPVYRKRDAKADYELQRHAHHRKDHGVVEPHPKVGVLEHLGVVLEPDERTEAADCGVGQAQHDTVEYREERYYHDDQEGGQDHVVSGPSFGVAELLLEPAAP